MKAKIKNIAIFCFTALLLVACNKPDPGIAIRDAVIFPNLKAQDIFKKSPQQMKKSISDESLADFVKEMQIGGVENIMETVGKLSRNEDNGSLFDASLDVLKLEKTIFENEYLAIAKMVDAGEPEEKIGEAVQQLKTKYQAEFKQKIEQLNELGKQYAAKNKTELHDRYLMKF